MRLRTATACYRELGAELRKRREAAGLSMSALARDFGCTPSHISRVESGHAPISEVDVLHYLGCCGVYLKDAHGLLAICRLAERHLGYWLEPHDPGLSDTGYSLIYHESTASSSVTYEPQLVPGLLQTENYTRTLAVAQRPNRNPEPAVRARQERQRILYRRRPAMFTFYLHEYALQATIGDRATMHEQLLALLLLDGLPQVNIRVVPASAGAQALVGGAFRVFEFPAHRPLVYLDAYFSGLFLEDSEYVDNYRELVPAIADVALNEGQSREFLAKVANVYDRERADQHVHDHVEEKQL